MNRYTITAYIRCYKDPELVLKCASYLTWADEILIADNSDDDSIKNIISQIRHNNVKYFYTDIVDWRYRLISLKGNISSDYLLMIDTDEYYNEITGAEILEILSDKRNIKEGYMIPSESYIFGEYLENSGANQLRLVKRDAFYLEYRSVHEMPKVKGSIGVLKNGYKHYCSPTFSSQYAKPFTYAMADAHILSDEKLRQARIDNYSTFELKMHFFKILAKLLWRTRGFFFSKKVTFVQIWQQYIDILVIMTNDIAPTEEIRIREGKIKAKNIDNSVLYNRYK